jgi:outer membrane murein-binding lipoprotein Lpp
MRKYSFMTVLAATVGVLLVAGGAAGAGHFIITNVHQIKPSVRAQLKGKRGAARLHGSEGCDRCARPAGPPWRGGGSWRRSRRRGREF